MSNDYIVPEIGPDEIVEVVGVGLVRNDKSAIVSEHPRKEDQVPCYWELSEEAQPEELVETPPLVDELASLPVETPVEETIEEPAEPVDTGGEE